MNLFNPGNDFAVGLIVKGCGLVAFLAGMLVWGFPAMLLYDARGDLWLWFVGLVLIIGGAHGLFAE